MTALTRDVTYGLRLLRRNPGFSLLSILIIALGIGASAAIFSLIYGTLLAPLPFADPARLAVIWSDFSKAGGIRRAISSPADYFDWRDRNHSFSDMAAYRNSSLTFTALDPPVTPLTHETTANYFDVMGVKAFRGRTFLAGEDQPGRDRVAIISYGLWKSAFAGADSAVGSTIELDGQNFLLVGVLPLGFRAPNNAITVLPDLWVPASFESLRQDRVGRELTAFGRLKPEVTLEQARAELTLISEQIAKENPAGAASPVANVQNAGDDITGDIRGLFYLLLGAVGIMLLIACANVANLLLARSAGRARELAIRGALGASFAQILRQMLIESLTLFLIGGAAGVVIANFSVGPLLALVPASVGLPFADRVDVNLPVVGFALVLSAMTAIVFGLAPARQALRASLVEVMGEGGRARTTGRGGARWRDALMSLEVALSVLLLAGAGLMIQTFWRLSRLDSGFDTANVLTVRNSLRGPVYATIAAKWNHFRTAAAKLGELPGVESVTGISFNLPIAPIAPVHFVRSNQPSEPGKDSTAMTRSVLPRFFETIRTPILKGRSLNESDNEDAARVVVISETLARRYFSGVDPVGQTIRVLEPMPGEWRIAGVSGDVRGSGSHPEPQPVIYFSYPQAPVPAMTFLLRTRGNPELLSSAAQRTLWSLGRLMNVYAVRTLEQTVSESYWQSRFTMILLCLFAGLALVLATAGLYAVISYLVSQRTQEIGIRMALGARPADVLAMVTGQGVRLAALGIAGGLAASLAAGQALAARLYGVNAADPLTLGGVSILLLAVAAAACAIPAFRAARIDPAHTIRETLF